MSEMVLAPLKNALTSFVLLFEVTFILLLEVTFSEINYCITPQNLDSLGGRCQANGCEDTSRGLGEDLGRRLAVELLVGALVIGVAEVGVQLLIEVLVVNSQVEVDAFPVDGRP